MLKLVDKLSRYSLTATDVVLNHFYVDTIHDLALLQAHLRECKLSCIIRLIIHFLFSEKYSDAEIKFRQVIDILSSEQIVMPFYKQRISLPKAQYSLGWCMFHKNDVKNGLPFLRLAVEAMEEKESLIQKLPKEIMSVIDTQRELLKLRTPIKIGGSSCTPIAIEDSVETEDEEDEENAEGMLNIAAYRNASPFSKTSKKTQPKKQSKKQVKNYYCLFYFLLLIYFIIFRYFAALCGMSCVLFVV